MTSKLRRRLAGYVAFILLLGCSAWSLRALVRLVFDKRMPTYFSARVFARAVTFTLGSDFPADPSGKDLGLLGSSGILDFHVLGCTSLRMNEAGSTHEVPCTGDALEIKHGKLARVYLRAGSVVTISVDSQGQIVRMSVDGASTVISVESLDGEKATSPVATIFGERVAAAAGQWRINPAGPVITLDLRDRKHRPLQISEEGIPLQDGSSVRLDVYANLASQATQNILTLPELPKDLDAMELAKGETVAKSLEFGTIQHIGLARAGRSLEGLLVDVTGTSPAIFAPQIYSRSRPNLALTLFEKTSGRDRRLRDLGIAVLAAGLLTLLSTLTQISVNATILWSTATDFLQQKIADPQQPATAPPSQLTVRREEEGAETAEGKTKITTVPGESTNHG